MDYQRVKEKIVDWIYHKVREAGCRGTVVGLSGGIDSAVVAALCQQAFPDENIAVIMPCESDPIDASLAEDLAQKLGIKYLQADLTRTYRTLLKDLEPNQAPQLASANLKPRLRMTTLYYYAAKHNYLVVGTGNRSELYTGYFTKYGDGGVDMEPIGALVKTQVRELARILGIPEAIISRPPTAGLWQGQTDEQEMQISYQELDEFILTGKGSDKVVNVAQRLHKASQHKRNMPPTMDL